LAQTPPQPTTASAILKLQSLAPLMGAPVELGRAANGPIVNQAALDAHAIEQIKSFEPGEFVNRHCVRIDPVKGKGTDKWTAQPMD
jgi:hypothetical protein